ncbi:hypothetical protein E2542_SST30033 [Spatholobus suberectus]|nr:hypothetical protein E2542_SST30033 [Spatholobus suberectus]
MGNPEPVTQSRGPREGEETFSGNRWMPKPPKIPFTMFDGNGYQHWRTKCEQYFILEEEIKNEDKVLGIKSQEKNHGGKEKSKLVDGQLKNQEQQLKKKQKEMDHQ